MKKIIFIICLVTISQLFSQDKFKFKSIDYGIGTYKINNEQSAFVLSSALDVTASYKSNLITLSNTLGFGFGKDEKRYIDLEGFYEISVLFGREYIIAKHFTLETHAGLGFITQSNTTEQNENQSYAIPVKVKLLYYTNDHFALGLNPNVSFNKLNTIYSLNLILHFKF